MNEFDRMFSRYRLVGVLVVIVFVLQAGCLSIKARIGDDKPVVESLHASLRIGESSTEDVRKALGTPYGTGRAMLPFQEAALDMWTYLYAEGTLADMRQTVLFVYIDNGVYDGHMWFSSMPAEPAKQRPADQ
jgi:hypothetical protein